MSTKSAIQLVILIVIFIILGGVYFKYFSKEKIIVNQTSEQTEKKITTDWLNLLEQIFYIKIQIHYYKI